MKKCRFSTELAYLLGILILTMSVSLMEAADFGVSMIVAPAYLLHLKLVPILPFFSFGMAEYTLQAALLLIMIAALRKFRPYFLFSFITAVFYGVVLDLVMALFALIPPVTFVMRIVYFTVGEILGAMAISLLFHTYIAPEVYELFVKEFAEKLQKQPHRVKIVYDVCSCLAAIIMSFSFFGMWHFEGVKLGTIITVIFNGWLIGRFTKLYEKLFDFQDSLPLRKYFT